MKVAVIGSRDCGDLTVEQMLEHIPKSTTTIVSGGALGVDTLAKNVAEKLGVFIEEFLPDYKTFGKRATLIRNNKIIDNSNTVIAFWNGESNGTRHAVLYALKKDKDVKIIYI